ncbi:MAG: beta-glucosidase [Solirubrobacteraceae bacterium]|nr:beta-glucosidase [Solirubrobacteraceae bacterium]
MAALSLEQKVRLLTGADFWSLHAEPAAGLRRLVVSDGPAGVRGERWDERDTSANVPSPTALAATWDEALVEGLGGLLAFEARRKGVDVLLAPTVNLHRTPFGGRHFECFSEDPLLTARIGVAYVRGVQGGGVGATVKHFVANDSETERMTLDARVDERTLRELYLAPFEAIVREAGVWSAMAAYNGVNGVPMTESPLLRDVLQREWGFDGVVMSDWFATRSTQASAAAGLDLVMPGPDGPWGAALLAAVRDGGVDEAAIDDKVVRILRLASRVGALEGTSAAAVPSYDDARVAATLRRVAAAGFVLARNDGSALPLDRSALGRVAVIGPNAAAARTLGGGSATVFAPYAVSPLDGLRAALGDDAVDHAPGVLASDRIPVAGPPWLHAPDGGGPGVEVRFLSADGAVLATERRPGCAFTWLGSFGHGLSSADVARIEVRTVLRATVAGTYAIAGSGVGRYALSVGGELVVDAELKLPPGADIVEGMMVPPQAVHRVDLDGGQDVDVVLAHDVGSAKRDVGEIGATFQLNLRPPHGTDDEEIERAVTLARAADVAVVVVGTTEEVESEGFDRTSLALPGRQDELVRRVAAANPTTVVVVNAGAPVLLPWSDEVAAILLAWFPGQEFGNALADVLLGLAEPGGRLPTTWWRGEAGLPSTRPVAGVLPYDEGLLVGYRRAGAPLYPFGHGLGYTTWEYEAIEAPDVVAAGAGVPVAVSVRNTGERRGKEVVQLYASRPDGGVPRPARWLVGFAAIEARAGERVTATVAVPARAFEHWDVEDGRWAVEPGTFALAAGGSSAVLPVRTDVAIERT